MERSSRDSKLLDPSWIETKWAPHLLRFNLLPSQLLHVSWHSQFGDPAIFQALLNLLSDQQEDEPKDESSARAQQARLHRHWSGSMLAQSQLDDQLVLEPLTAQIKLAILPEPEFSTMIRFAGGLLIGKQVRQVIAREEVLTLEKELSPEMLQFVRMRAHKLFAGLEGLEKNPLKISIPQIAIQLDEWGGALFLYAMNGMPLALIQRVEWRLPIESKKMLATLNSLAPNLSPQQALTLLERLIDEVDKKWLSSFPKTH